MALVAVLGRFPVLPFAKGLREFNQSITFSSGMDQAVRKVMAEAESGGSWTLAFPSLILTVCKGWLQMAVGFS